MNSLKLFLFLPLFLFSWNYGSAAPISKNKVVSTQDNAIKKSSFYYLNTYYFSFADRVVINYAGQKTKARSQFSSFGADIERVSYSNQYFWSVRAGALSGTIDTESVPNVTYPRKSFTSLLSGAEVGYRLNQDLDLSYGLGLYYITIQSVDPTQAFNNQLNFKFRLSNNLTLFQSFGNFGAPLAYSYSFGLRWIL